jgi:outer membrane protein OmpA-like peptidoglycan-associated protein
VQEPRPPYDFRNQNPIPADERNETALPASQNILPSSNIMNPFPEPIVSFLSLRRADLPGRRESSESSSTNAGGAGAPPSRWTLWLGVACLLLPLASSAQEAAPLNVPAARAALATKPPRNPVKSSAPIVKRTYERRPAKGLVVETGAPAEVDVEVVHRSDGTTEERPYVSLPILFVVNSDSLLDDTSRSNAARMADVLRELIAGEQATFAIQGHTSAEGTGEANQTLSDRRAARIQAMLLGQGLPPQALSAIGLGEAAAQFPESAPEVQRQQDRRVLIVRMK